MGYTIAAADEYLAITGINVKLVKICKKAWVWPWAQKCTRFSVRPHDYAMNLQAMTKEKLQFLLPVVFTVGPDVNARGANATAADAPQDKDGKHDREDRGDALMKYAMLLTEANASAQHLENIVKGIIEGETRVIVSNLTMEEIFTGREEFKRRIYRGIQSELAQFGLKIYNANVKELRDAPDSSYFESLARKAHEGATNQARVDVAAAQLKGTVGEAQRRGEQEREIAKINAETAVQKTERDGERASAEASLATRKTVLGRDVDIAKIEAARATESKDEELKRDVEVKRAAAEVERLRANDVVKATIAREAKQQAADARAYEVEAEAKAKFEAKTRTTDADAYSTRAGADAANYQAIKDAEAKFEAKGRIADADAYSTRTGADAANYMAIKEAQAMLEVKLKEAEGLSAMAGAYGKMSQAFGGPAGLLQYMMIREGTYIDLAKANATAVHGMQPKISVWNTGAQAGEGAGSSSSIDTMRNVYQMLPPLMETINDQTGITLPEWQFGRLNNQMSEIEKNKEIAKLNGSK